MHRASCQIHIPDYILNREYYSGAASPIATLQLSPYDIVLFHKHKFHLKCHSESVDNVQSGCDRIAVGTFSRRFHALLPGVGAA